MKKLFLGIMLLVLAVALVGCGGGGGSNPTTSPTTSPTGGGTIKGLVYAPDNITPIVGASVTVQGNGKSATTDVKGAYTLAGVPAGNQKIIALKGSYRAEISVTVTEGQTVTAGGLSLAPTGKIGVVEGSYDNFRDILTSLKIKYEIVSDSVFSNPAALSQFSVIFFECGLDESFIGVPANITNLQNFVKQGGSIYASDWASSVIEAMYPDKISFAGTIGNEQTITANIADSEIKTMLGKSTASICFDLSSWVVIKSIATGVITDLSGTVDTTEGSKTNIPLMVHFPVDNGYVVYTSFHNEAQVTEDVKKILKHLAFEL
jgi:hypothetical protein